MSAAALQDVQSAPLALIGSARAGRRMLLDMLLSAKGYEIAACEDGPAVLEFLKENQPAIAIFDHDLPGMDGREICSRMRFITRLAETPIAIVTPTMEEMGGVAVFENFTDTTTADIVEAEPLGKKRLVERLENVIRDQKGAANDGKMTIAIPTMVPPIPKFDETASDGTELDVFVDDDVDIEIDVARAIYSTDNSLEQQVEEVAAAPTVEAEEPSAGDEFEDTTTVNATPEEDEDMFLRDYPTTSSEEADQVDDIDLFAHEGEPLEPTGEGQSTEWLDSLVDEDAAPKVAQTSRNQDGAAPWDREPELVGVSAEAKHETEPAAETTTIGLASDESEQYDSAEGSDRDNAAEEPIAGEVATVDYESPEKQVEQYAEAAPEAEEAAWAEQAMPESVNAEQEQVLDEREDDDLTATIEAAIEAVNLASMEEAEYLAAQAATEGAEDEEEGEVDYAFTPSPRSLPEQPESVEADDPIDVKATVEMVVETAEAVSQYSMTDPEMTDAAAEAAAETSVELDGRNELAAAQSEVDSQPADRQPVEPQLVDPRPEPEVAAEVVEQAAEFEGTEPLLEGAKDYAGPSAVIRIESPSIVTDGQEEGDAAVLNEERANMQALIAEQAERIESLQERNVLLRQELEQRKADDALRNEERGSLQALIKEQTEAITNLQQRNVQLRQELEQFKAEEVKRASERTFLQAHTSEQAETIAKLQQLNSLLRQELEQRKADEAPLRDFLQRLLDRDEQNSAYQEAMRKEIISLTRENS